MDQQLFDPNPTLTVSELTQRIGTVIRRAFAESVWVEGEIHSLSRAASGHVYFDLVEPATSGRRGAASIPAVLWESEKHAVNQALREGGAGLRMTDGLAVRIRGQVTLYAAQSKVQLQMSAIDPTYTLGRMAAERDRLLQALAAEGLLDRNERLALPAVPLRVGLVTSDGSAACADFLHELEASRLGWRVTLVDARVQGLAAGPTVVAGLAASVAQRVDVVALVRGGGARSDLAAFDSEVIARAIAACPVPVLTGIGHETDESVADLVAHTRYKTPTACAAGLVDRVRAYCTRTDDTWARVARRASESLGVHQRGVDAAAEAVVRSSRGALRGREADMALAARQLATRAPRVAHHAARHLDGLHARVWSLDPARTLARGWSVTRTADGVLVRSPADVAVGDRLVTRVADGELTSVVDA